VFYIQDAMYVGMLGVYLTVEVTYTFCLVKNVSLLLNNSLTFYIPIFACRELLLRCNIRISTLFCVYGVLFFVSLTFELESNWRPNVHSLVHRYWKWAAMCVCVCGVSTGVTSIVVCYVPYTILMPTVVFHV
jgi:hypothetical protein